MIFLSHPHHRYTQDFRWLLDAFGEPYTRLHGDRATLAEFLPSLAHSPPRLLVLFQLEHLAPWCSQFCPVMLFPMYDCTRGTPDSFLRALGRVEWVSFSRSLHQRLGSLGLSSRHLRYAPDPDHYPEVSWRGGIRGYFWERTPEHLDRTAAGEILRALGVDDFEVRRLEDQDFAEHSSVVRRTAAEKSWEDHAAYLRHLQGFQVYLAPRRFEGLGLTFLEAMAMGMCVVAENQPTAEEYITAGLHGILYRGDDRGITLPRKFSVGELESMGRQARQHLRQLHREWRESRPVLAALAASMMATPYARSPQASPGLLEATMNFLERPEQLRAMVAAPSAAIYRSSRQQAAWGSWAGRFRTFLRRPREVLRQALEREPR